MGQDVICQSGKDIITGDLLGFAVMAKPKEPPARLFIEERMAAAVPPIEGIRQLEEVSGIAYHTIDKWIRYGQTPRKANLERLARALHCTVAQLFRHPELDTGDELLKGLPPDRQRHIREIIAFERSKLR